MTKKQEAIERLKRIDVKFFISGMNEVSNYIIDEADKVNNAIETVLNMLKEKDVEIEKLKQALARNIAKNFTSIMKESAKSKEDLEMLNAGWQIELEKKDKIIDLMAEYLDGDDTSLANYLYKKNGKCNKEMIKQYFERKVKE